MYKSLLMVILIVLFTLSQNLFAEEKITSNYEFSIYNRTIKSALDRNELDKAEKLISEARDKLPDSSKILYHAARYEIKKNFVGNDSILGGHTSPEGVTKVIALINEAREKSDFDGSPLSWLVHLYARNGETKKAYEALDEFNSFNARDPWIIVNTALIYLSENNLQKAFGLLSDNVLKRKLKDSDVYNAAWYYLQQIRDHNSKFELNEAVKGGFMERVAAKDLVEYVNNYRGEKPLFVAISSQDTNCGPCVANNEFYLKAAKSEKNKYKFILSTTEPWVNISAYPDILDYFSTVGTPFSSIHHKGEMLDYFSGKFLRYIDVTNMLSLNLERAKSNQEGRFLDKRTGIARTLRSYSFLSFPAYLLTLNSQYKSLAIATNSNGLAYVGAHGISSRNQQEANDSAIKLCESRKNQYRKDHKDYNLCQIVLEGNKFVSSYFDNQTLSVLNKDIVLMEKMLNNNQASRLDDLRLSAENGDARSQYLLGLAYKSGTLVQPDINTAISWFEKAANNGYGDAQRELGHAYRDGKGVKRSEKQAMYWYEQASNQGDGYASLQLGWILTNSDTTEKNYTRAVQLFQLATENNAPDAWSYLAFMYENGYGLDKDLETALKLYQRNPKPESWAKQRAKNLAEKLDTNTIN